MHALILAMAPIYCIALDGSSDSIFISMNHMRSSTPQWHRRHCCYSRPCTQQWVLLPVAHHVMDPEATDQLGLGACGR